MIGKCATKLSIAFLLLVLVSVIAFPTSTEFDPPQRLVHLRDTNSWSSSGPYVDRAIFVVITAPDVQMAALISGDVDHISDQVDSSYFEECWSNPNIETTQTERLRFDFMAFNCLRYPYNIPALRRAIAFAMDKHAAASAMWEGLGFALDSPIPASCGVWHNNNTNPDFREPNVAAAQAELARAEFRDRDGDGFVEAPNGESFTFQPMVAIEEPQWQRAVNASLDYWEQAGIRVSPRKVAFSTLLDIVYTIPRNFDAACFSLGVSPNPLSLQNFISSEVLNAECNMLNWGNSTYDDWVEVMMNSSDFTEVQEAAHQAQQVFVENAPMIVMSSNWVTHAHRTDKFEGWVVSPGYGMGHLNLWNPLKVKLKVGQPDRDSDTGCGGTFRTIISSAMDSQNPLTSTSRYGHYPLFQVYSKLTHTDPRDHDVRRRSGGLAYDWTVQSHPAGAKYTFTLYDNATWHDLGGSYGGLVTAHDVEFSYNYIKDYNIPTYSQDIPFLNSCRALDHSHVEIITNGESYWVFDSLRDWVILPEHVWEGIVTPVIFTNPRPIGCGPFRWYRRREGEYVELHFWENYHKGIPGHTGYVQTVDGYIQFYPIYGVIAIIGTLVGSGLYLYAGRGDPHNTQRPVKMEKWLREREVRIPMSKCPSCRAEVSEDDLYCANCGKQIRE